MVKKVKGLSRGIDALIDKVKRDVLSRENLDMLAEQAAREAATLIRRRTRQGLGVSEEGGSKQALKPLSRAYIERRKVMRLSSFTSAGKSNLTLTSELLDSMNVMRTKAARWSVTFLGQHTTGIPNAVLAQYVSRARPFMYLARDEIDKLSRSYRKSFADLVKRKVR